MSRSWRLRTNATSPHIDMVRCPNFRHSGIKRRVRPRNSMACEVGKRDTKSLFHWTSGTLHCIDENTS